MKKLLALFVLLLASAAVISAAVITTKATMVGEYLGDHLRISGEDMDITGNDYTYVEGTPYSTLTIKSNKKMTIRGTTDTDLIVVDSPNGADLIFSNLSVSTGSKNSLASFEISAGVSGDVNITLDGTNVLSSGLNYAGLQKSSDACTLIIDGTGSLTATGGDNSAGIGGGNGSNGSNITIKSGTIEATGGTGGAGIGGGNGGSGSNIQIYGGTITATTLSGGGAGIGGGNGGNGEKLYIFDCVRVSAKSNGGGGAGIGGGLNGDGNDIQIQGGDNIEATGSNDNNEGGGAGIGGGARCNGTNIIISGGSVEATGGSGGAAGIGGGNEGSGSGIEISGGSVEATGGSSGAGIGGGYKGSGTNITISGGKNITATNYGSAAGIGGGKGAAGTNITISGGKNITATGGFFGAGIGGGDGGDGTNITISGGDKIIAKGGSDGAGIGGGYGGSGSGIEISGGLVEATGVDNGAGIGGGNSGNGSGITIKGSAKVTATGGYRGAGIGGGYQGDGSNITIGDNSDSAADVANRVVIAKSEGAFEGQNGNGAGIGGGGAGNGDTITIYNGIVTAESDLGAGIGGGGVTEANASNRGGNGTNITINDGNITATSNCGGAGIGGGQQGGCGSDITINDGTVTATSKGNTDNGGNGSGAGIGGGSSNTTYNFKGNGENIIINGGIVIATGNGGGAGIGGGGGGDGTSITITGNAVVKATGATKDGYDGGAGIGGGNSEGAGTDIEISGNAKVIAAALQNGASIGGGSYNVGANITIKENADVTVNYNGCRVCIGSSVFSNTTSIIEIKGGTVTAADTTVYPPAKNQNVTASIGIGSMGPAEITISGAKVDVAADMFAIGSGGDGFVTINKAEVTAVGNQFAGINCNNITINGNNDTKVTATCNGNNPYNPSVGIGNATDSGNCTVTITGGKVTAANTAGGTGIGGNGSTVNIEGTRSTSYPWVFTNKIESVNGNGDYYGIVFDDAHKGTYTPDVDGNTYAADGVVYGGEGHTIQLTEPYTLANGKLLRVQKGTTFVTTNENKLTLDGSILYLEEKTTLDKYNKITIINGGDILHEDPSDYRADGTGKIVCDICGKEEPHNWKAEWVNTDPNHHWHECDPVTDCSVYENSMHQTCSITDKSKKAGYGEHVYGAPTKENGMLKYVCTVCGYSYSVPITIVSLVKVDENDDPLVGAVFGIHSNADSETPIETAATAMVGDNAVVSFDAGLGGTYYIKETQAPEGYELSDKVYKAVVGADGTVTYGMLGSNNMSEDIPVCKNSKNTHAQAKIIKTDDKGAALAEAVFGIYSDEACETQITTATTAMDNDEASATNGKAIVSFTTEFGKTYYIKEITAPEGYTASNKVYTVIVGADGKITYGVVGSATTSENIPVCENKKSTASDTPVPDDTPSNGVKIIKVDSATQNPLAGAQFGLYSDEECTVLITTKTTAIGADNKAVVSFDTEPNKTYYIKEIAAPEGYTASDKVYKAVVDADGKITYGVVGSATTSEDIPVCENEKLTASDTPVPDDTPSNGVKIIKVDSATQNPLAGAQFGLYSDEECTVLITTKTTAIGTDNKAVVSFDTEPNKTYYIKEIAAPEGYTASDKVYKAFVGADGKITYGVVGSATTSEDIPVCENEKSASDTSVPADTPNGVNNPETGVALGTAGFAILSGIICTISSKRAQGGRKRKNGDDNKIDF